MAIQAISKENQWKIHVWLGRDRFRLIPASDLSEMIPITGRVTKLTSSRSFRVVTPGTVVPPLGPECKNPLTGGGAGGFFLSRARAKKKCFGE